MSYGSAFCAAVGNGYSVNSAVQLLPAGAGEACGVTAACGDGNSPLEPCWQSGRFGKSCNARSLPWNSCCPQAAMQPFTVDDLYLHKKVSELH